MNYSLSNLLVITNSMSNLSLLEDCSAPRLRSLTRFEGVKFSIAVTVYQLKTGKKLELRFLIDPPVLEKIVQKQFGCFSRTTNEWIDSQIRQPTRHKMGDIKKEGRTEAACQQLYIDFITLDRMYNLQGFYTDLKAKKIQLNCVLRPIKDLKFREIFYAKANGRRPNTA